MRGAVVAAQCRTDTALTSCYSGGGPRQPRSSGLAPVSRLHSSVPLSHSSPSLIGLLASVDVKQQKLTQTPIPRWPRCPYLGAVGGRSVPVTGVSFLSQSSNTSSLVTRLSCHSPTTLVLWSHAFPVTVQPHWSFGHTPFLSQSGHTSPLVTRLSCHTPTTLVLWSHDFPVTLQTH